MGSRAKGKIRVAAAPDLTLYDEDLYPPLFQDQGQTLGSRLEPGDVHMQTLPTDPVSRSPGKRIFDALSRPFSSRRSEIDNEPSCLADQLLAPQETGITRSTRLSNPQLDLSLTLPNRPLEYKEYKSLDPSPLTLPRDEEDEDL